MVEVKQQRQPSAAASTNGPTAELSEMLELRWQLAEAEIRSDLASTKRLAIVGGTGTVAVLTGLSVLATVIATKIDGYLQLGFPWAAVCVALLLMGFGLLLAWSAWRRYRREFLGFRESIQELQEDLVWIRERFDHES